MRMKTTITIAEWLARAAKALRPTSETPLLEAQALLTHFTGLTRVYILTHPEHRLDDATLQQLDGALERLCQGEPLPYVLGEQEFYGLPFKVTPAVLIPRPETELLVEQAIVWLNHHPERRLAADVGTGSGCIAISLAHHIPDLIVLAVDRSRPALEVARENLRRLRLSQRVHLLQADLLGPINVSFDVICANLPYIPTARLAELKVAQHEPHTALDGGPAGLDLIQRLLEQAPYRLAPGGLLLAELDASQALTLPEIARRYFPQAQITLHSDPAGLPRLLAIQT